MCVRVWLESERERELWRICLNECHVELFCTHFELVFIKCGFVHAIQQIQPLYANAYINWMSETMWNIHLKWNLLIIGLLQYIVARTLYFCYVGFHSFAHSIPSFIHSFYIRRICHHPTTIIHCIFVILFLFLNLNFEFKFEFEWKLSEIVTESHTVYAH